MLLVNIKKGGYKGMYKVYCDNFLLYSTEYETLKIFNAVVELELNKTGTFIFTLYPSHPYYDKPKKMKSIITVYQGGYLLFRGRILDEEQGFYSERKFECEGELAFLLDSIQRPYDFLSGDKHTDVKELFIYFIENHNAQVQEEKRFKIGNITVKDPNNYITRSDCTYSSTLENIQKKLLETHGGYLFVRHEKDGNYIDYLEDFDTISTQKIEFGQNLLTLNKSIQGADIATAIIPLGAKKENSEERLNIADINNGLDYVYNEEAVKKYGWIFKTVTFDDVTVTENLMRKGKEYLDSTINLLVSIELTAADLSAINRDVNSFRLGTYINVYSKPHGLDQIFLINKLSINLLNPAGNSLQLGTKYASFTESTKNNQNSIGELITKVENVENNLKDNNVDEIITNVVEQFNSSLNQQADEILFQVSENYYLKNDTDNIISSVSTELDQTKNEFNFQFNSFFKDLSDVQNGANAKFEEISKYIRFIDGNIILGVDGNELTLKIQRDKIAFLEGTYEVAYWKNKKFYVTDGEFTNSLKLGNFAFVPRENGNLSFRKVQ